MLQGVKVRRGPHLALRRRTVKGRRVRDVDMVND